VEKFRRVARQRDALALDLLPERLGARVTPTNAAEFVAHIDTLPATASDGMLAQRIRRALQHYGARHDVREVVTTLESQAGADADAVESSYAMVRVFIWAVPVLGFIGTVLGIGAAVGGFSDAIGSAVDLDVMKNSIGSVTGGLSIAFDTTLLALVMSILIMFPASAIQRREEAFLAEVDDYCAEYLIPKLRDELTADADEAVISALAQRLVASMQAGERREG
jgi:biopolymer transport protein ExbB/TolQ